MDIADINEGAGDNVVGDIGIGRSRRGGRGGRGGPVSRKWAWWMLSYAGPGLGWIPFYGQALKAISSNPGKTTIDLASQWWFCRICVNGPDSGRWV